MRSTQKKTPGTFVRAIGDALAAGRAAFVASYCLRLREPDMPGRPLVALICCDEEPRGRSVGFDSDNDRFVGDDVVLDVSNPSLGTVG